MSKKQSESEEIRTCFWDKNLRVGHVAETWRGSSHGSEDDSLVGTLSRIARYRGASSKKLKKNAHLASATSSLLSNKDSPITL